MDDNLFGAEDAARLARIHADIVGWTTQMALEVRGVSAAHRIGAAAQANRWCSVTRTRPWRFLVTHHHAWQVRLLQCWSCQMLP